MAIAIQHHSWLHVLENVGSVCGLRGFLHLVTMPGIRLKWKGFHTVRLAWFVFMCLNKSHVIYLTKIQRISIVMVILRLHVPRDYTKETISMTIIFL